MTKEEMRVKLLNAREEIIEVELAISRSPKSFNPVGRSPKSFNPVGPYRNVDAINYLIDCENALAYILNNIGNIYNAEENV